MRNAKIIKIFGIAFGIVIALAIIGGIIGEDSQPSSTVSDNGTAPQPAKEPEQKVAEVKNTSFTDPRDSKVYKIVTIGKQIWMAENLNYNASDSKCYVNNPANCDKYGRLYNWETAKKSCPKGWHLPNQSEWEILTEAVGGEKTEGKYLKATSGWNDYNGKSGNGEDKFGFAALPGGTSYSDNFDNIGNLGYWWSSSEDRNRKMYYYDDAAEWDYLSKKQLCSVRCLKD